MTKGTIQEWKVKVGDPISEGTVWCVLGTDKANISFNEVVHEGFVAKLYARDGDELPVGKVIALLVDEKEHIGLADSYKLVEDTPAAAATPPPPPPPPPPAAPPAAPAQPANNTTGVPRLYGGSLDDAIKASGPAVALLASKIDRSQLQKVVPSGKGGRFTKSDLSGLAPAQGNTVATVDATPAAPQAAAAPAKPAPATIRATPVSDLSVSDTKLLKILFGTK